MSFTPSSQPLFFVAGTNLTIEDGGTTENSEPKHVVDKNNGNYINLFLKIVISAIIFLTIIAIYNVINTAIDNYYSNIALNDPNSNNTQEEIDRTNIANYYGLISTIVYALVCLIISIILVPILFIIMQNYQ